LATFNTEFTLLDPVVDEEEEKDGLKEDAVDTRFEEEAVDAFFDFLIESTEYETVEGEEEAKLLVSYLILIPNQTSGRKS